MMLLGGFIAIAGIAAIILAFLAFSPVALAVSIGVGSAGILGGIGLFAIPAYRVVKENACRGESLYSVI